VAELLASMGFWVECRRTIRTTADQYAFRGPYEGGRIEGEELLAFAQLCHTWADRYIGVGVVKGPDRTGYKLGAEYLVAGPEAEYAHVRYTLTNMADLAEHAYRLGGSLFIDT
jgi:hypothetical protein